MVILRSKRFLQYITSYYLYQDNLTEKWVYDNPNPHHIKPHFPQQTIKFYNRLLTNISSKCYDNHASSGSSNWIGYTDWNSKSRLHIQSKQTPVGRRSSRWCGCVCNRLLLFARNNWITAWMGHSATISAVERARQRRWCCQGQEHYSGKRQMWMMANRRHINHLETTMTAFCRLFVLAITVTAKMTLFAVTTSPCQ